MFRVNQLPFCEMQILGVFMHLIEVSHGKGKSSCQCYLAGW